MNRFSFLTQPTLRIGPLFNLSNKQNFRGLDLLCEFLVKEYSEYPWANHIFPSIVQPKYQVGVEIFLQIFLKESYSSIFGKGATRAKLTEENATFVDCRIFLPFNTDKIIRHATKNDDVFFICGFDVLVSQLNILKEYIKIENDEIDSNEVEIIQSLICEYYHNSDILSASKNEIDITTYLYKVFRNALNVAESANLPMTLINFSEIGNADLFVKLNLHNGS